MAIHVMLDPSESVGASSVGVPLCNKYLSVTSAVWSVSLSQLRSHCIPGRLGGWTSKPHLGHVQALMSHSGPSPNYVWATADHTWRMSTVLAASLGFGNKKANCAPLLSVLFLRLPLMVGQPLWLGTHVLLILAVWWVKGSLNGVHWRQPLSSGLSPLNGC